MEDEQDLRKKSLWAMKAVTAGALLFAGVACSSDDGDSPDAGWNITENNGGSTIGDADHNGDTGQEDAGIACNTQESNGVCPEHCTKDNDIDCCYHSGGDWWNDQCGPAAVPGPFVPPRMPA